jgi:hypothetical protein
MENYHKMGTRKPSPPCALSQISVWRDGALYPLGAWLPSVASLTALFATPRAREAAAPNPARALDRGGRRRFLFGLIEGGER